jgi:hypothetical protein
MRIQFVAKQNPLKQRNQHNIEHTEKRSTRTPISALKHPVGRRYVMTDGARDIQQPRDVSFVSIRMCDDAPRNTLNRMMTTREKVNDTRSTIA